VPTDGDHAAALAEVTAVLEAELVGPPPAFIIRTSGSTTGTGSLVALPWEAMIASAEATHEALGGPGAWLTCLPIHHVAGLQTVVRSVIAGQTPTRMEITAESLTEARAASSQRLYLSLVPTQLADALQDRELLAALRDIDAILVGGQATPAAHIDAGRAAGLNLVTTYGMTETCGGCVYNGRPIGDMQVEIRHNHVVLRGSAVASGYLSGDADAFRKAGKTREFTTSDTGTWNGEQLTVLGRADDAFTSGGVTVNPSLIERLISEGFGGVVGVVVPENHPRWGESGVLVTAEPVELTAVRERVAAQFEPAYAPGAAVTLADLGWERWPLTGSGKVDRRAVRKAVHAHAERTEGFPWQQ